MDRPCQLWVRCCLWLLAPVSNSQTVRRLSSRGFADILLKSSFLLSLVPQHEWWTSMRELTHCCIKAKMCYVSLGHAAEYDPPFCSRFRLHIWRQFSEGAPGLHCNCWNQLFDITSEVLNFPVQATNFVNYNNQHLLAALQNIYTSSAQPPLLIIHACPVFQ